MKTPDEIAKLKQVYENKPQTNEIKAFLDVLDNNLSEKQIEEKYYDEDDPWVERAALDGRSWLDGDMDEDLLII